MKKYLVLFVVLILFSSCSIQKMAIGYIGDMMDNGMQAFLEEGDLKIVETSLISNLKFIEALSKNDPENEKLLFFLSMGYGSYSLGFLEDSFPERATSLYSKAKEFGLRILRHKNEFAKAEKSPIDEFEKSLKCFAKDDVPALFWSAYNWGNQINLNISDLELIADLPKADALMKRVIELDDSYYYGGAYLYLGSIYAKIPQALGGDTTKAKECFEKAIKISRGKFLMIYVYYAKMYAVAVQDKVLYIELLNKVLDAPSDILPEQVLPNALAKEKAKNLLKNIENYF